MTIGMVLMVGAFTVAGIIQAYLWRMVGLDFMTVRTQYETFWMFLVFLFGLVLFLPGVIVYLWDFFGLTHSAKNIIKSEPVKPSEVNV